MIDRPKGLRVAVLHGGAPSPGMNPAVRAFVRLGIDKGYVVLGVRDGFSGLAKGDVQEMNWMSVNGWALLGGAELGTNRSEPTDNNIAAIAKTIEEHKIQVLVMFGGYTGYQGIISLRGYKDKFPALDIPVFCLPGTIANNVPATENSVGADTSLNNILDALDKIKQSAVASRRVFVVEVMGADCGYLAMMAGLASGAERAYINEAGVSLKDLQDDLRMLKSRFEMNHKLGLIVTSEKASDTYGTHFVAALFKEEGKKKFDVRESILGHIQQGGSPSAYDRTMAAVLMEYCLNLIEKGQKDSSIRSGAVGFKNGEIVFVPLEDLNVLMHPHYRRPLDQWWMSLNKLARNLATRNPNAKKSPNTIARQWTLSRFV